MITSGHLQLSNEVQLPSRSYPMHCNDRRTSIRRIHLNTGLTMHCAYPRRDTSAYRLLCVPCVQVLEGYRPRWNLDQQRMQNKSDPGRMSQSINVAHPKDSSSIVRDLDKSFQKSSRCRLQIVSTRNNGRCLVRQDILRLHCSKFLRAVKQFKLSGVNILSLSSPFSVLHPAYHKGSENLKLFTAGARATQ
jgi:hypothetical protein